MSHRSFTRAHARRIAAAARREAVRRHRATLVMGVAVGATALSAASAQAATYTVTTASDVAPNPNDCPGAACTLRDAITAANASAEADTVTFASDVTGTITLTQGTELTAEQAGGPLTVTGPGADKLTVSGDADGSGGAPATGDTRILNVEPGATASLSGLTLSGGYATSSGPGASKYDGGGAAVVQSDGTLTVSDATLSGNAAAGSEGGGALLSQGTLDVERSTLSGNTSMSVGGAIQKQNGQRKYFDGRSSPFATLPAGPLTVRDSVLSGNTAANSGGAVSFGSTAPTTASPASPSTIATSTLAQNSATNNGGGLSVAGTTADDALTVSQSTVSGNQVTATSGTGGGVDVQAGSQGALTLADDTIAGNSAASGGGLRLASGTSPASGAVKLQASTVAANTAATSGGGLQLETTTSSTSSSSLRAATADTTTVPGRQPVDSTIIAGNTTAGAPGDLGQPSGGSGSVALSHSLVQTPGTAVTVATDDAAPSLLGVDPQLGALADNGGPTKTLLPAAASPVVDAAKAPAGLTTDQRGLARTVDLDQANATGGDGTDIGAVELPRVAPATTTSSEPLPPAPSQPVTTVPKPPAPAPVSTILPLSRPKKPSAAKQPITLHGTAVAGSTRVDVSVGRKTGRLCRFLKADGTFTPARSCLRTSYLTARGTTSWTLKLPKLPKGKYIVWSRAFTATRVETKLSSRNFTRLTIK